MRDHAAFLARRRFDGLDGLRAIAVLAVIWHHTAPVWADSILARSGFQGVTLFFAISGFLITSLLLREQSRCGRIDLKAFYMRRCLRIFPLYFGTLLIYVVLVSLLERGTPQGEEFWQNLKYFLTYTSNLFVQLKGRVIFYFSWSLAAEEQFYLIWPTLLLLLRTPRRAMTVLCGVIVACVVGTHTGNRILSAVPVAIVAGSLMALGLHLRPSYDRLAPWLGQRWSSVAAAAMCSACIFVSDVPPYILHICMALLVATCVLPDRHALSGLLNSRVLVHLGTVSYGMYMLHMLCRNVVDKVLHLSGLYQGGLEIFFLTMPVSILVATLSFKYFEAFFLGLKHRFER